MSTYGDVLGVSLRDSVVYGGDCAGSSTATSLNLSASLPGSAQVRAADQASVTLTLAVFQFRQLAASQCDGRTLACTGITDQCVPLTARSKLGHPWVFCECKHHILMYACCSFLMEGS
jgi:hypothetical protein